MKTTVVPIQGTFDIAQARARLRTHLAPLRWSPLFTARSSTAVTALGELIIAFEHGKVCPVRVAIEDEKKNKGISFSCSLHFDEQDDQQRVTNLLNHLRSCVDSLDISMRNGVINLEASIEA